MKKIIAVALAVVASLVVGAGVAFANGGIHTPANFNQDTPDVCARCHRPHRGLGELLLVQRQDQLCFSCHNGSGSSLNVLDGQYLGGTTTMALRGGGFANAIMDTDGNATLNTDPTTSAGPSTSSHSVDHSAQTAWGGGTTGGTLGTDIELSCGNCHNPHTQQSGTVSATDVSGTLVGTYRMLRPRPEDGYGTAGSALIDYGNGIVVTPVPSGTPPNPADPAYGWNPPAGWNAVSLPDDAVYNPDGTLATPSTYTYSYTLKTTTGGFGIPTRAGQYKNVSYATGAGWVGDAWIAGTTTLRSYSRSKLSLWCGLCHTRYVTDREVQTWYDNPYPNETTPDPVFTYRHSSDLTSRNCFSCHVVHGTKATMGGYAGNVELPKLPADPAVVPAQNSRLLQIDDRGMCYSCHSYKSLSQP